MASVDPDLVESLAHHDEYLTVRELVRYLERHHPVEGSGVPRELVEAYADELGYDRDRLREQRVAGDIVLYAFQNPEELVRLPEETGE